MEIFVSDLREQGRAYLIIRGFLALAAGIAIIIWPGISLDVISFIAAVWVASDGLIAIYAYFRARRISKLGLGLFRPSGFMLLEGILQLMVAVIFVMMPTVFGGVMLVFFALFAIWLAVVNMTVALGMRSLALPRWWVFFLVAFLALLVAVVFIVYPMESITFILWFVGITVILQGAALLAVAFADGGVK